MKRHIAKDIALVLLPLLLFLAYTYPSKALRLYSAFTSDYFWLIIFNAVAPAIVGAILCAVLIYAWKNRASTIFIYLFCGAFLMNLFLAFCSVGAFEAAGNLRLGRMILVSGQGGVELSGVIDGTYVVLFWVSLVSFIKARKKNMQA